MMGEKFKNQVLNVDTKIHCNQLYLMLILRFTVMSCTVNLTKGFSSNNIWAENNLFCNNKAFIE
jgi:hypothetical protein